MLEHLYHAFGVQPTFAPLSLRSWANRKIGEKVRRPRQQASKHHSNIGSFRDKIGLRHLAAPASVSKLNASIDACAEAYDEIGARFSMQSPNFGFTTFSRRVC